MFYRLLILGIIVSSCHKDKTYQFIEVFGHAGNGLHISNSIYHDNSQEAINLALAENGCDGVEIDVQLSANGTAWLYHDSDLSSETNGNSCINSLNDEEISKLHYKSFNQEKLVRLENLALKGKSVVLDLRHSNSCESKMVDVAAMKKQINEFQVLNPTSVIYLNSNNPEWIKELASLKLFVIYSPDKNENISETLKSMSFQGCMYKNHEISEKKVQELQDLALKVFIFEVRAPKDIKKAFKKHPDFLVTDDLKATIIEKY